MTPKQQAMLDIKREVGERILGELQRQQDKWGDQWHNHAFWYLIVAEEFGEVAKALLDVSFYEGNDFGQAERWDDVMQETIETIACLMHLYHEAKMRRDRSQPTEDVYTP